MKKIWFFLQALAILIMALGCSSISEADLSSYIDRQYLKSINKFTAISVPFDIGTQQETDNRLNTNFPENYVKFYDIYNPTDEWSSYELKKRLNSTNINSLLIIGPAYIIDNLPKNAEEMIDTLEIHKGDIMVNNDKIIGYLYNLHDNKLIGIFQVNITFYSSENDFTHDILPSLCKLLAKQDLMTREISDIYLKK